MLIYILCWFDRHTDPFIQAFADPKSAEEQLDLCKEWRPQEYVEGYYIQYYVSVRAQHDDGPHGYIIEQRID
ncbi:hypothetical protein LCGC14_2390830 [marine sediment metagenome]|uniref:Uncharacterized protein n=1 Tax=marine sediment metagenome TaxID=412755 RepID=A0A0F9ESS6_9ZZZZ